ncbi:tartrate-resistant acid phosphatase type 5-like [Pholidichthys leucotaenia]
MMAITLVFLLAAAISVTYCDPTTFQQLNESLSNRTSLKFLVVGDWGGLPYSPFTTKIQRSTADEMGVVSELMGADFIVAVGDNFYFRGVESVDSPRFKETFESVYTAESLQIPWYLVAGNHDHMGNVEAEIEYSRVSDRWNFPSYYYELNFRIPNTGKILTIIMLDTIMLCGHSDDNSDKEPEGPPNAVDANRQLVWLQQRLALSKADFLLVGGHYPVWSVSEHGPTRCLVDSLRPLLLKYRATAYLCGHEHNLQYIEESDIGYVVSGAGNFMDPDISHWHDVPKGSVKFFTGQPSTLGGFVHAEVNNNKMILTFFKAKGTSLFRTVLSQRKLD